MRHILILFILILLSSQSFPQDTHLRNRPQEILTKNQRIFLAEKENKIGVQYWKKKEFASALEHFRKAAELNPKKSLYFFNSGNSAKKLGRTDEAAQWFKQAVEIAVIQKDFKLIAKYNDSLNFLHRITPTWAKEKTKQASQLPDTPEIQQASKEWRRLHLQARKKSQFGYYSEALQLYTQALELAKINFGSKHPKTINSIQKIASIYHALGHYLDAESLSEKSLRLNTEVLGEKHPYTLSSTEDIADIYQSQGRYADAEPLYLKVLHLSREVLGERHLDTLTTLGNLALNYQSLGRYSEAEPMHKKSLKLSQELLGENHPLTITSLNNLALLYSLQGRYSDAERLYEKAFLLSKKVQGAKHPETLVSATNLALLYISQGRYSKANSLYEKLLLQFNNIMGEKHPHTLANVNNLAELYRLQGRYAEAEPLLEKGLRLTKEILGEKHPDTLTSLNNLAILYSLQGRYTDAEPLLEKGLRLTKEILGEKHPDTLNSLNNLAVVYLDQERYADAEPLLEKGFRLTKEILGEKHPETLRSLHNLTSLYSSTGRYSDSEPLYKKTLHLSQELLGEKHPATLITLNNFAKHYTEQERYSDAEPLHKKGLRLNQEVLGATHPQTLFSLKNLVEFYQIQGQFSEAEIYWQKYLRKENIFLEQVIWGAGESTRQSYLKLQEPIKNGMLSFFAHLNTPETAKESLYFSLSRKGLLLKISSEIKALVQASENPELQEQADQLRSKKESLSNLTLAGPGDGDPVKHQQRLKKLVDEINRLEAALGREVQQLRRGKNEITPKAILATLGEDEVLIDFLAYRQVDMKTLKYKKSQLMAVVVDKRQEQPIQLVFLGELKTIEEAVEEFREHVSDQQSFPEESVRESGEKLHRLLWQPLQQFLQKKESVFLVPDGILHLLPFSVLTDPEDGKYLVEKHNLVILSSGRDLVMQPTEGETQNSVIISSPSYSSSTGKDSGEIGGKTSITRGGQLSGLYFAPLPGTGIEGNQISQMMRKQGNTPSLFSGSKATEASLKQVKSPRILHLATHGFFLDNLPSDAVAGSGSQRGSPFSLSEQFKQQINPQKAVLSKKQGIQIIQIIKNSQASDKNLMIYDIVTEYAGEKIYSESQFLKIVQSYSKRKKVWMTIERSGEKIKIELKGGKIGIAIQDIVSKPKQASNSNNNPLLRSGLALYGANQGVKGIKLPDGSDGVFTAMEALGLRLNGTQLVVLSACETGVGDVQQGEGVFGLRRAFEEAGAHFVLSTLWTISDEGTQVFMKDFYTRVLQGENPRNALRTIQRAYIKNQQWSHPFYWAPFVIVGRE